MASVGERSVKRRKVSFDHTFEVLVGIEPAQKTYTLHHDVFVSRSPYFKAALSKAWARPEREPVDMTDQDPETLNAYLHCVYCGKPDILESADVVTAMIENSDKASSAVLAPHFAAFIKLYVLADKLGDLVTANLTMDNLI